MKLVNSQVPTALKRLGYDEQQIADISAYLLEKETIEGAPHLKPEHLPIFDCSFKAQNGTRSIDYMGHIKMMGAVQPFISGAISKTVNLPNDATPDDIRDAFIQVVEIGSEGSGGLSRWLQKRPALKYLAKRPKKRN